MPAAIGSTLRCLGGWTTPSRQALFQSRLKRQLQPKLGCVVHSDMIQLLTKERKRLRWLSEGVISALTF
jgi:hypothetical protein